MLTTLTPARVGQCTALAVALGLATGCAGGLRKTLREPSKPLEATTVFVYPIRFLGSSEPGWRNFELSERMLEAAVAQGGDQLAFFGPTEFKVLRYDGENAWVSSTALPLLVASGSRPEQGLVIRPVVERRVNSSVQEAQNEKGQAKGATSNELTTWVARLDLLHPSTQEVILELEGQVTVDPFAEPTPELEYDPAPALTALVEKLTTEAVKVACNHSKSREIAKQPEVFWAVTPRTALSLRTDPALVAEVIQLDALQTELLLQNIARVLKPSLTEAQANAQVNRPAGLAVLSPSGKLAAGDVIETVDGLPALPHVIARGRFKGAPVELKVRHPDGSTGETVFP